MKKAYEKPDVQMISLMIPESIATEPDTDGDMTDGETGLESSIFPF